MLPEACDEFIAAEKVVIGEAQGGRGDLKAYESALHEFNRMRQALTDRLKSLVADRRRTAGQSADNPHNTANSRSDSETP